MISPTLNVPQARFLSMPHKFKAYIAGFGSGKTWVGCGGICKGIWEHPGINQGYFAPTYPQIRDIFYPTVEEVAADWGLNVKINEGNKGGCCQLTDLVYDGVFEVLQWLLFLSAVPPVQLLTGWCVTAKALPDISAISALTAVKHGNCSSLTPLLNPVRTRKSLIWP